VSGPLVSVERVSKAFVGRKTTVRAVDDVSFDIAHGECFGLVGESGSGKSTLARCILRLADASTGRILFDGTDVAAVTRSELRALRRRMQVVFQDPYTSLDPRMSIRAIVEEPLLVHRIGDRNERWTQARDMLERVGLGASGAERKPHSFSGGQRQRIALARALMLEPEFVVLDEPVSALDVSIQAQVVNLLRELQRTLGLTYLFITHDLAIAEYFCHRIGVLYLGRIMECASAETLFAEPLHPYTHALLSAVPVAKPSAHRRRDRIVLSSDITVRDTQAKGCPFEPRCPVGRANSLCREQMPTLAEQRPGHWLACHFPGESGATRLALNATVLTPPAGE
jgi:oligopeptide/dipeptide ABC transporter ATP-binding protein